jgi:ribose 1,5-bisphosphokinase PhnN
MHSIHTFHCLGWWVGPGGAGAVLLLWSARGNLQVKEGMRCVRAACGRHAAFERLAPAPVVGP